MFIQLNAINCFYDTHQVLNHITFQATVGEVIVLLGPSGAGKSTLLRVCNLLTIPQSGQLKIFDTNIDFTHPPSEKIARNLRKQVGMVFQQYNLWPHLTVVDNLIQAPCRVLKLSKTIARQHAVKLLDRLQLKPYAHRYPLQLSGGQQQRVAIARALMMKPRLLLFDEPTAALDPEITAQVVNIMRELAQDGMTLMVVSHDIELANKVADKIIYLERGLIVEQGDPLCLRTPKTTALAQYLSH